MDTDKRSRVWNFNIRYVARRPDSVRYGQSSCKGGKVWYTRCSFRRLIGHGPRVLPHGKDWLDDDSGELAPALERADVMELFVAGARHTLPPW